MIKTFRVCAISPELEFIALHERDATAIRDNAAAISPPIDPDLVRLTSLVYERANKDAKDLLCLLTENIDAAAKGLFKIKWPALKADQWHISGKLMKVGGSTEAFGWIGLQLSWNRPPFRLIGHIYPRGGSEGRHRVVQICGKKQMHRICLASTQADRYPDWIGSQDGVIWLDEELNLDIMRDDLKLLVEKQAKQLLRATKPILIALAS